MEHAEGSVVIEAPLEDVMEVIEDYESYPEWSEVQTVDIRKRGEGGRAYEVAY
ncbi:MAG: SRPBCC family protein, partial [Myxococcota bacterium]